MGKGLTNPSAASVQLRLGPIFADLENWRRQQSKIPYRSEAIRHLLRKALEAEQHLDPDSTRKAAS